MHAHPQPSMDDTQPSLVPEERGSNEPTEAGLQPGENRAEARGLSFWYGKFQALNALDLPVVDRKVTALIGPSGCGKTTLLRCFNRMHDLYAESRYDGAIWLYPENENLVTIDPVLVRLRIGMVFQKPNPFPKSIYANVAAGLTIRGIKKRSILDEKVERALQHAGLWKEVKDRLQSSAYGLSGGQQQRLCIARALAPEPDMILFDEPTSALDPAGTAKIEDLLQQLASEVTILIVTHNMQQASRISDYAAFMLMGDIPEYGETKQIFSSPRDERTERYITGRFG